MKKIVFIFVLIFYINGFSQSKPTIFDAARNGDIELAKKMFAENKNVFNTNNTEGYSPLILACYRGNFDLTKFMIKNKANINASSSMGTPLMAAVVKGHTDIVKLLLNKNANVNIADANGTTCLMYATLFKNKEIIMLLLENKADKNRVDNNGKTAFEFAITNKDESIINLLK